MRKGNVEGHSFFGVRKIENGVYDHCFATSLGGISTKIFYPMLMGFSYLCVELTLLIVRNYPVKGTNGKNGGGSGDMYLEVQVGNKEGFKRKGQDVYSTIQIPYTTAVFGGEVIVPTLYGQVSCRIKEGTKAGTKIRLRGKGIPYMDHPSNKGDQYVTVEI